MLAEFQMDCYQTDVVTVVEDVFRTMLELEVSQLERSASGMEGFVSAEVQFVGEWKGAVVLQCSPELAFDLTVRLMHVPKPNAIDQDVRDALGELANMVGGNLKSVLPPGVALSMPSVVVGSDYVLHICGGRAARTRIVPFASELGEFWVTLVQVLEKRPN
jgi:chemotaxis protein CheX